MQCQLGCCVLSHRSIPSWNTRCRSMDGIFLINCGQCHIYKLPPTPNQQMAPIAQVPYLAQFQLSTADLWITQDLVLEAMSEDSGAEGWHHWAKMIPTLATWRSISWLPSLSDSFYIWTLVIWGTTGCSRFFLCTFCLSSRSQHLSKDSLGFF